MIGFSYKHIHFGYYSFFLLDFNKLKFAVIRVFGNNRQLFYCVINKLKKMKNFTDFVKAMLPIALGVTAGMLIKDQIDKAINK